MIPSNFGPRDGARKSTTPVVSVTVIKRAAAEKPTTVASQEPRGSSRDSMLENGHSPSTRVTSSAAYGPIELPATLAECEALHERLVTDSIRLELALSQAQESSTQGRPYDRSWYNRARAALKHINHDRTRLLYRCGQLRKEAKTQTQQHLDRVILDVIKEALPADQFMGYVRIAEARAASGAGK